MARFRAADGVPLGCRYVGPRESALPPLVLLHGAASNGTRWWHLASHSRLRHERLLLCPDLRGHGLSLWRGPAGSRHWCDDLAELLRYFGQPRALVGGHCLGANVAAHFAARHPEHCAGLVLIEPMVAAALTGSLARLRWMHPGLRLALTLARIANRLGLQRRRLQPLDLEELDRSVWRPAAAAADLPAMRRRYASPRYDLKTLPTVQYLNNLLEVLRPLPLDRVICPALAILSSGRLMAEPAITRQALAALGHCEIVELPAQHWIPTEQPQALCATVDAWVERLQQQIPGAAGP